VHDGVRLLGGAQDEVVVLGDAQRLVEAAQLAQQRRTEAHHVDDVRVRSQVLLREARPVGVAADLVRVVRGERFVRVEEVGVVLGDRLRHAEEGMLLEDVVVVEQDHVAALRHVDGAVERVRDAAVGLAVVDANARIRGHVAVEQAADERLGGSIVADA
jgi:hypothetical protein